MPTVTGPERDDESQAPDNQVRFRADPEMVSWIRSRMSPRATGLGAIAKRDLERYYQFLGKALPTFPEDDAIFILDALRHDRADHQVARLLWAVVADASRKHGLGARWGVDEEAIVAKLRDLSDFEKLAIVDACERARFRYWGQPLGAELEDDRKILRSIVWEIGLADLF